jgi:site-specific DNA-methyltransferase (adenine-specific)
LEYLIKTYTDENDIVLDNCMGSGSTGVACKNINREFIGIEKDEKYFNIAKERIEKKSAIEEFIV